eukprot:CAMPEP_0117421226 /NCGR_PEP_ID=MMETSP0758-20121206/2381_1 /TAXON_ID=63605 /ORGANISM="Percolomonas cosmopolitus, Strain AE-1 (ATCC 50343)" /LENGTH=400 /DNA_ID=CAMNT_0005203265 /DNA_START=1343 /DNA_END=2542 /DNA_ORIENTATION=-
MVNLLNNSLSTIIPSGTPGGIKEVIPLSDDPKVLSSHFTHILETYEDTTFSMFKESDMFVHVEENPVVKSCKVNSDCFDKGICIKNNCHCNPGFSGSNCEFYKCTTKSVNVIGTGKFGFDDGYQPTFNRPASIYANDHVLFVADSQNHKIRKISLKTLETETYAGSGVNEERNSTFRNSSAIPFPIKVVLSRDGDVVVDHQSGIVLIDEHAVFHRSIHVEPAGVRLTSFSGFAFTNDSYFFSYGNRIYFDCPYCHVTINTEQSDDPGNVLGNNPKFDSIQGLALLNRSVLLIVDSGNCQIKKMNLLTTTVSLVAGRVKECLVQNGAFSDAGFLSPTSITIDSSSSVVYVLDAEKYIRVLHMNKAIVSTLSLSKLERPVDLFWIHSSLFIADFGLNQIIEW